MPRSTASSLALLLLGSSVMISAPAQDDDDFLIDGNDCEEDDDFDDDDRRIEAELLGLCEVPSISTTGRGIFKGEIDDAAQTIAWSLSYRNLEAPVEQAHIHFGQEHTNGGISVFLCTNLGNGPANAQACPDGSADLHGTIMSAEVAGPTEQGINAGEFAELLSAIRSGATYVNVHTATYPMGEIRGQIVEDDDDDD